MSNQVMKTVILLLLLVVSAMLEACSVDAEIEDSTTRTKYEIIGDLSGINAGANYNYSTDNEYNISCSLGNPLPAQIDQNDKGFVFYSTNEGYIYSEESFKTVVIE